MPTAPAPTRREARLADFLSRLHCPTCPTCAPPSADLSGPDLVVAIFRRVAVGDLDGHAHHRP